MKVPARTLKRYELLLQRELKLLDAEEDPIAFCEITMPVSNAPHDPAKSRYAAGRHHRVIADALKRVESGESKKLIINIAPRHGKSELVTKRGTAWIAGRNPDKDIIVGTYANEFAGDIGRDIRSIMQHPAYAQVFPDVHLQAGSEASDRLRTTKGGQIVMVGRGGTVTGRGGVWLILDDPFKGSEEANSPTIREKAWTWFVRDFLSRRMDDDSRVVIITTRWHEDDIVGRLTDPNNPCYRQRLAMGWEIIDMPALAVSDDDIMGRKTGEALWPERFNQLYLEEMREADPTGFNALYQCRPAPEEGAFYEKSQLVEYQKDELPPREELRIYAASDHAVGLKQTNDKTALGLCGVDRHGTTWILPETQWRRMDAEMAVEAMLGMIKAHRPLFWWAERGHISKSIGPFLRRRMREESTYCSVIEMTPIGDKMTRTQPFQARCAQGRVRFPAFAPWWPEAKQEILQFPFGRFDDFVDMLSMFGMGLDIQVPARTQIKEKERDPSARMTFAEMHRETRNQNLRKKLAQRRSNW